MSDLVGTVPKTRWESWLAEGDCAGESETGKEWAWWTVRWCGASISAGERLYIVAHGRLRGWAPVVRVERGAIIRAGGAVACTIPEKIEGFQGLRHRWWPREAELPFPDWREP